VKKKTREERRQDKKRRPYQQKGWSHRPGPEWPQTKPNKSQLMRETEAEE
jgi:hypothetical protein